MTPTRRLTLPALLLTPLLLAPTTACIAPPPRPGVAVHGVLEPGGAARGTRADGTTWGIALEGTDVLLELDGAALRFVEGAPGGRLAYEHVESAATWRLELACGVARCRGRELELLGQRHRLRPGRSYRFDARGALESEEPR